MLETTARVTTILWTSTRALQLRMKISITCTSRRHLRQGSSWLPTFSFAIRHCSTRVSRVPFGARSIAVSPVCGTPTFEPRETRHQRQLQDMLQRSRARQLKGLNVVFHYISRSPFVCGKVYIEGESSRLGRCSIVPI